MNVLGVYRIALIEHLGGSKRPSVSIYAEIKTRISKNTGQHIMVSAFLDAQGQRKDRCLKSVTLGMSKVGGPFHISYHT